MRKTLDVTIPHQLSREEAKVRIVSGVARLHTQLGPAVTAQHFEQMWQDYRMTFKVTASGQSINGWVDVEADALKVSIDLPWILAVFADVIRGRVSDEGRKLLEKK